MPDSMNPLAQELLKRELEDLNNQPKPKDPTGDKSFWVDDDEVILKLRQDFLPNLHPSMPRVLVRGLPLQNEERLANSPLRSNAFTVLGMGDPHIYVNRFTPEYRGARSGNKEMMKKLASILAHENAHIYTKEQPASLADELQAYEKQLEVLKNIGASPKTIQDVERSRDAVAREWNKR